MDTSPDNTEPYSYAKSYYRARQQALERQRSREREQRQRAYEAEERERRAYNRRLLRRIILVCLLLLFLWLLFLFIIFSPPHYIRDAVYSMQDSFLSPLTTEASLSTPQKLSPSQKPPDEISALTESTSLQTKPHSRKDFVDLLPLLTVQSAIENYRQRNGTYPPDLKTLLSSPPENYLSSIPSNIIYYETPDGYVVLDTFLKTFCDQTCKESFELIFYPESNQLALTYQNQSLATYAVASGASPLPFTSSTVSERVYLPNGGGGALGTRGLVLEDNYAIHGTNDPSSIGKRVSAGCLRLHNSDIEQLYPYISLGTSFKVLSGQPESAPIFPEGLPPLGSSSSNPSDSSPPKGSPSSSPSSPEGGTSDTPTGKVYTWKY